MITDVAPASQEADLEPTASKTSLLDKPELLRVLLKWQTIVPAIKKELANDFHNSKYADLAAIWDQIREPLTDLDLLILHDARCSGARLFVDTILVHVPSMQSVTLTLEVGYRADNAQALGSALTYLRRYGTLTILNLSPEGDDDDGDRAIPPNERERISRQRENKRGSQQGGGGRSAPAAKAQAEPDTRTPDEQMEEIDRILSTFPKDVVNQIKAATKMNTDLPREAFLSFTPERRSSIVKYVRDWIPVIQKRTQEERSGK